MEQEYVMHFTKAELESIMAGLSELPFKQVIDIVNKINTSYVEQCAKQEEIEQEERESKGAKHNE